MMSAAFATIGLVGAALYLGSYAAVQIGRMDGNGTAYTVANTLAAALVLISLFDKYNTASVVIQVAWLSIGLTRLLRRRPPAEASQILLGERPRQ